MQWTTEDPIIPNRLTIKDALYFAWSLPISVLISGNENAGFMKQKIELAKKFKPLNEKDRDQLISKVTDLAREGKVEYYKKVS